VKNGRTHPTFIEIGTDRPLYVHRRGSNVVNGEYYVDYNPERTVGHYGSTRAIPLAALRQRYAALRATSPADVARNSPIAAKNLVPLPPYFATRDLQTSDLNVRLANEAGAGSGAAAAAGLVSGLNGEGYWPAPLRATSNPYTGATPPSASRGDFATTHVGDATDTSPYPVTGGATVISTGTYIQNMSALIDSLHAVR
jgi:hypothetical protein